MYTIDRWTDVRGVGTVYQQYQEFLALWYSFRNCDGSMRILEETSTLIAASAAWGLIVLRDCDWC